MASYWRIAYPGGIGYTNNEDIYNEAERYKYSTGARGAWVSELGEANEEKFKETDGGCVNINDGKWVTKGCEYGFGSN
jgi:hypothetical protein